MSGICCVKYTLAVKDARRGRVETILLREVLSGKVRSIFLFAFPPSILTLCLSLPGMPESMVGDFRLCAKVSYPFGPSATPLPVSRRSFLDSFNLRSIFIQPCFYAFHCQHLGPCPYLCPLRPSRSRDIKDGIFLLGHPLSDSVAEPPVIVHYAHQRIVRISAS